MKISIALCTYNGARYLFDQLVSIAVQTRPPDELVVCDDGSRDGTVEIVRRFAETVNFPVVLHVNEENMGSFQNFGKAIGLCSGDLIALSDQDDVWLPEKLAVIAAEFERRPELGLVFTDAEIVDSDLRPTGECLLKRIRMTDAERQSILGGQGFYTLLKRNLVTGATMAFRAEWKSLVLPIEQKSYLAHDAWIALLISAVAPVLLLSNPLIRYRQHEDQIQGVRPRKRKAESVGFYETHLHQLERIRERLASVKPPPDGLVEKLARIDSQRGHLQARIELPHHLMARVARVARELCGGRYHRYSNGFHSAARDLLHP